VNQNHSISALRMASKAKSSQPTAPKARKRKAGKRQKGNQNFGTKASVLGGPQLRSAPASIGMVVPQSKFRMDGKAQSLTDWATGMGDSCRVIGSDMMSVGVSTNDSDAAAPFNGAYYQLLTPNGISPRLAQVAELFQFYALREVQVMYIPVCGSTTAGMLALAVVQDYPEESKFTTLTLQKTLELTPSTASSVWQTNSMTYCHRGTKLWQCSSATGEAQDYDQAALAGALYGTSESTVYGQIFLQYVIDFYKPTAALATPARERYETSQRLLHEKKELKQAAASGPTSLATKPIDCPSSSEAKKEAGDMDPDSPVLIKSQRGLTVYTDSDRKDKLPAPHSLSEKGSMSTRGAR